MTGSDLFWRLRNSSLWSGGDTAEKERIFNSFWSDFPEYLRSDFDSNGIGYDDKDNKRIGFGLLVEEFARRSSRLPSNTESGEKASQMILSALRDGKGSVLLGRSWRNPDFIWVDCNRRSVKITGIGEVKSSAKAVLYGYFRVEEQEATLNRFIKFIKEQKHIPGLVSIYFQRRMLSIDPNLEKLLIVPFGEAAKIKDLTPGWKLSEIEFSREELLFIARNVWPGFNSNIDDREMSFLENFKENFLTKLQEWSRARFEMIFADIHHNSFPDLKLMLFNLATGLLPLSDEDIHAAIGLVDEFFNRALIMADESPRLTNTDIVQDPNGWERGILDRFSGLIGSTQEVFFLLSFNRHLCQLLINEKKVLSWMETLEGFDPLNT